MNGHIIPNTPIAVDFWRILKAPNSRLFFLSHAHSDHMSGLTSSWLQKIYCSEITARIVKHRIGLPDELLHPLSLNEPHIVPLDVEGEETMTVTLIDANHCPGAVMFLFEGYFGRILYTGDFRHDDAMFEEDTILGELENVDDLYLDNTYCHPDCNFPSQKEAKKAFMDLILQNLDKHIVIPTNELGKENLFEELALITKTYIQVRPEKLESLKLLNLKDVFTTDPEYEQIRLIPRKFLNTNLARKWDEEHPTLVVVPTALTRGLNTSTPYKNAPNVHVIPYSEHSSYSELHRFVEFIKPKRIVPIVQYGRGIFGQDCKERTTFEKFQKYLDKRERLQFEVPESVRRYMNGPKFTPNRAKAQKKKTKNTKKPKNKAKAPKGVEYETPQKSDDDAVIVIGDNQDCETQNVEETSDSGAEIQTEYAANKKSSDNTKRKSARANLASAFNKGMNLAESWTKLKTMQFELDEKTKSKDPDDDDEEQCTKLPTMQDVTREEILADWQCGAGDCSETNVDEVIEIDSEHCDQVCTETKGENSNKENKHQKQSNPETRAKPDSSELDIKHRKPNCCSKLCTLPDGNNNVCDDQKTNSCLLNHAGLVDILNLIVPSGFQSNLFDTFDKK